MSVVGRTVVSRVGAVGTALMATVLAAEVEQVLSAVLLTRRVKVVFGVRVAKVGLDWYEVPLLTL